FQTTTANGGTIQQQGDTLVYTPGAGFTGIDVFSYTVGDGTGLEDDGLVTVTVTGEPDPVDGIELTSAKVTYQGTGGADVYVVDSADDSTSSALDRIRAFNTLEGDKIDVSALGLTEGDLTFTEKGTGQSWVFTRIDGPDGFRLRVDEPITEVEDGIVYAVEGEVPPNAVDDSVNTNTDTAVSIDVLDNDSDANGDDISITDFDATSDNGGTIVLTDNELVYTPLAGFTGQDTFSYEIGDGITGTDTATVTVTVGTPEPVEGIQLTSAQVTYQGTPDADVYVVDDASDSTRSALDRIETFTPDEGDVLDLSALGFGPDDFQFEEKGSGQGWVFTRISGPDDFLIRIGEDMDTVMEGIVYEDTLL
ncbi:MAG: Ig-like domain-containing protein, partial [Pseudomonadota bacterium]